MTRLRIVVLVVLLSSSPVFAEMNYNQPLFSSYWFATATSSTQVELTNHAPVSRRVTLVVQVRGQQPLEATEIEIPSLSTYRLNLGPMVLPWLSEIDSEVWGAAIIDGETDGISGWIVSREADSPIEIESLFLRSDAASSRLVAQWWRPTITTETLFVLQNVTDKDVAVQVLFLHETGRRQGPLITIGPRQTRLLTLDEIGLDGGYTSVGAVDFHVEEHGAVVHGRTILIDRTAAFAVSARMNQPLDRSSNRLHAAGGPIGNPGVEWGFPEDVAFHTEVVVTNLSETPIELRTSLFRDSRESATGPSSVLKPYETVLLEPAGDQTAGGFHAMSLEHSGRPSDISAVAFSVDQRLSFASHCPFIDDANIGSHKIAVSFDLSANRTTLLILRNVSDEPIPFRYLVNYRTPISDGRFQSPEDVLGPWELRVINLATIRDQGVVDVDGVLLPMNLERGSVIVGADRPVLLAADPTIDRLARTVTLCDEFCTDGDPGGNGPLCAFLSGGFLSPEVYVLPSIFSTLLFSDQSGSRFECHYKGCGSGRCQTGVLRLTDQPYCSAGVKLDVVAYEWLIFRLCNVLSGTPLSFRPC